MKRKTTATALRIDRRHLMERSVNEKLIDWIKEKAETEYANDISIVVLYGSFLNGTAHSKSDIDCYFIPRTEHAFQFANDFIIDGVGYDIFPITWERAEGIANLQEALLPLIGDVKILYYHSEEDLQRFTKLQSLLKSNLTDQETSYAAARQRVENAYRFYHCAQKSAAPSVIHKNAGGIIMTLADAVALYHHTYYHYGLKRQFSDLQKIPEIPEQIWEEYRDVICAESAENRLSHCSRMMQAVCRHLHMDPPTLPFEDEAPQEPPQSAPPQADYKALAAFYEEVCSTFNKIYVCCEGENAILAYLSATCLQEDLDYAHAHLGAQYYDLISSFHYHDLDRLRDKAEGIEKDLVDFITSGGVLLKKYDSFEEFAAFYKAQNTS